MIKRVVYIATVLLFSGCTAGLTEPDMDFKPPEYVQESPAFEEHSDRQYDGSLFGQGDNPLFADHKALHVNDIVTVVISEQSSSTNSAQKSLQENDSNTLGGGVFAAGAANANPAASALLGKINGVTDVGFSNSSNAQYNGQGSYQKNATFSTTISARVIKVLENGYLYVHGRREIMVDDQKQVIQISGVIRPYDIDQGNQINSSQISHAKIRYESQGDVRRATDQGWATKLVQAVWPF